MDLKIGQRIDVAENDYKFGVGRLRLRVTELLGELRLDGAVWARVRGFEICWNGTEACQDREALIRVSPSKRSPNGKVSRAKIL